MILAVSELPFHLPARGALIGVDVGTKRIGVATSDPDRLLASAVETIARRTFAADAARLLTIVA
ncbi:MAG TPA: Holliday junction resolvase RuvX, partial [Xanthobacteraceae bacterium]